MKQILLPLTLCLFTMSGFSPVPAVAVSYPVSPHHQISERSTMTAGATVYLFHSGTPDVKKAVAPNDILLVFGDRNGEVKEVGKVRVRSFVGECYLQGEVAEGEIRHDDVAGRGGAALLVILKEEMMK